MCITIHLLREKHLELIYIKEVSLDPIFYQTCDPKHFNELVDTVKDLSEDENDSEDIKQREETKELERGDYR